MVRPLLEYCFKERYVIKGVQHMFTILISEENLDLDDFAEASLIHIQYDDQCKVCRT